MKKTKQTIKPVIGTEYEMNEIFEIQDNDAQLIIRTFEVQLSDAIKIGAYITNINVIKRVRFEADKFQRAKSREDLNKQQ
ncbi:MAG: hypothetical protein EZS28_020186 [Streblomastix strix]|uniref:Uncharacterized protein n=1 Tax=Streblomastix strix TaxID=222440 RepID=A0A5J4VPM9_9EUKA|nr:MAG: hypothetical protein EZS28_020186 [Streblomastix strix]